jgi:hypothetical protein
MLGIGGILNHNQEQRKYALEDDVHDGDLVSLLQDFEGSDDVFVWKSQKAMDKGRDFANANSPVLMMEQVACVVKVNTKAIAHCDIFGAFFTGAGHTIDVTITEGPHMGCSGTLLKKYVKVIRKRN